MKKKEILYVCLKASALVLSLILVLSLFASCKPRMVYDEGNNFDVVGGYNVLDTTDDVIDYLYGEYDYVVSIEAGVETKLDTPNHNQTTLNNYYNDLDTTSVVVSNTCAEVAVTSLIEYYAEQEGFTTNDSYKDTFVDIMTIAIEKGYWDEEAKGTYLTKLDSLVTDSFGLYGSSSKGNNDYYSLYSKICEHVDDGVPVIFSVPDHGMVACGYVTYTVTYNKNGKENKPKTVTENFVIVNDGWSDEPEKQYSYFPEGLISTNVFTRWDYCITKVV